MEPPQLAAVPLPGQSPPITVPIGAYTPKERVFLHMATRQKRRGFFGHCPLLISNRAMICERRWAMGIVMVL